MGNLTKQSCDGCAYLATSDVIGHSFSLYPLETYSPGNHNFKYFIYEIRSVSDRISFHSWNFSYLVNKAPADPNNQTEPLRQQSPIISPWRDLKWYRQCYNVSNGITWCLHVSKIEISAMGKVFLYVKRRQLDSG